MRGRRALSMIPQGEISLLSELENCLQPYRVAGEEGAAEMCWVGVLPCSSRASLFAFRLEPLFKCKHQEAPLPSTHGGRMDRSCNFAGSRREMGGSGRKGYGTGPASPEVTPERGGSLRKGSIWDPAPHGHSQNAGPGQGSVSSRGRQLLRNQAALPASE